MARTASRYNHAMPPLDAPLAPDPSLAASQWLARLADRPVGGMPLEAVAPDDPIALLAAFCEQALVTGKSLLLLVDNDQLLPELSNALDLSARPLCLILPEADFTARITLRASLSLLKSRLNREVEPAWQDAWAGQKHRLEEHAASWQAALQWSAAEKADAWPAGIARLFPVLIAPVHRAVSLFPDNPSSESKAADIVLILERGVLPPSAEGLLACSRVLLLTPPPVREAFLGALALSDKEQQLRGQVEMVSREIAELELELATAQGELADFAHRYHSRVGSRIATLDMLQAELALRKAVRAPDNPLAKEAADAASARAEQSRQEQQRYQDASGQPAETKPFNPDADLKKLFRQVAQKIHPDRARDEQDRSWRTKLMAEANRAYRTGDTATLQEVLHLWQKGQPAEALLRSDRSLLEQQLDRLKQRLAGIQRELDELYASRLYELFQAERQARKQARDLLAELENQFDLQIASIKVRLKEMGWEDAATSNHGDDTVTLSAV